MSDREPPHLITLQKPEQTEPSEPVSALTEATKKLRDVLRAQLTSISQSIYSDSEIDEISLAIAAENRVHKRLKIKRILEKHPELSDFFDSI